MPIAKKIKDVPQLTGSFNDWLKTAKHGDRCIYHTGLNAGGTNSFHARNAHAAGLVALVQRRRKNPNPGKPDLFDYIAERCKVNFWDYETGTRGRL